MSTNNYFSIAGGYSFGDATFYRLGFMYSMIYGHTISSWIDIECAANITGRDSRSNGFTQILSSLAVDGSLLFKLFQDNQDLRIGIGLSARRRQFHFSAPSFGSTLSNDEDRYISDVGIGGNASIQYIFFRSESISCGSKFSGQFFIPINGTYLFQDKIVSFASLQFPFAPAIISLGVFLRVSF